MWRGISLANKCLLLFGGAIVLIVLTALSVPWLRMNTLVDEGQLELSRQLVDTWIKLERQAPEAPAPGADGGPNGAVIHAGVLAARLTLDDARAAAATDRFLARAIKRFESDPGRVDLQSASWTSEGRDYNYARAVRSAPPEGELQGVILLQRRPVEAVRLLAINTAYLLSAGFVVLGLAVLVFYLITHQIILSPVRALKETAERVREGDLTIRSEISTGDEFEELSGTFNAMLAELARNQDQLRAINSALDIKLNELAEANTTLYEAAKLKGEFLATISHELRTPLNSIIGFAELLREAAQSEADAGDDSTRLTKRIRYLENITTASRNLLDMINSLLEMARIEAGKADLNAGPINLRETCEGLLALISPLAMRKGIDLKLEAADDLPIIETDLKKFQQVIFNFLSNAVKFTETTDPERPGSITLRAEKLPGRGVQGPEAQERVRVSVIDTGPGIAPEDQQRLFQKFQQLDGSHTRGHTGSGLGLAICKELATILQAEIQLVSEPGRGSMFSVILPLKVDRDRASEQKLESAFRGTLAGRRAWI